MNSHDASVSSIASQVHHFYSHKTPFRIYHGSTNSTRHKDTRNIISTAHLTNVEVKPETNVAIVEPNVPMDQLVHATLPHGLVPLVVMEFPGITVGGGFSGTSGESSSFRHGFFDATVNWIEIVLPTGEVRIADKRHDPELFWGAASAFGTLGVVTLLEVQLRPAKPFVELRYLSASSMKEAVQLVEDLTNDPETEYLDGIVYGRNEIVICAGRLVDSAQGGSITQFTRPTDEWYYLHARKRASSSSASSPSSDPDYIPLPDYLFRYDRGGFWVAKYAYDYFLVPFLWLTRYLLDYFMHTRVMYHALHESGHSKQYIIQDVAVPYNATSEFLEWLDDKQNFGYYPIWLCPLKQTSGLMNNEEESGYLMNFGIWAPSPFWKDKGGFVEQNRRLEHKVRDLGGKKWLYAHAYYTEEEFWEIYDKKQYDALRVKYHAGYLPDLYEKVRVNLRGKYDGRTGIVNWVKSIVWEIWPVSGLVGVYRSWRGGEYLLRKKK